MDSYQTEIFKVLKNTLRRNILLELLEQDLTPGYFALVYERSPAAITRHLKILEEARLITRHRQGTEILCRINIWGLKAIKVDWLIKLLL